MFSRESLDNLIEIPFIFSWYFLENPEIFSLRFSNENFNEILSRSDWNLLRIWHGVFFLDQQILTVLKIHEYFWNLMLVSLKKDVLLIEHFKLYLFHIIVLVLTRMQYVFMNIRKPFFFFSSYMTKLQKMNQPLNMEKQLVDTNWNTEK